MSQLTFRLYDPSDSARLREITIEAFKNVSLDHAIEQRLGIPCRLDWQENKWRQIEEDLSKQPDGIFVAEIGQQIVGYITTRIDEESGVGRIPNLAVDALFRRQGIGRKLLEHALRFFRQRGLDQARIETLEQNAVGQKLYPSLGFEKVSCQIHYCLQITEKQ